MKSIDKKPIKSSEIKKIVKLLRKEAIKCQRWNEKNRDKCGHSQTPDSLGDEGWNQLISNDGLYDGLSFAANTIEKLLKDKV